MSALYTKIQPWQTRVLRLRAGARDDALAGDLLVVDLVEGTGCVLHDEQQRITYEALSYTWGSPTFTEPIELNGMAVLITPSLGEALKHTRYEDASVYVWADALCINQQDTTEKSFHVQNMYTIYRKAKGVVAWLGVAHAHLKPALALLRKLDNNSEDWSEDSKRWKRREPSRRFSDPQAFQKRFKIGTPSKDALEALRDLICRPYFGRAWVQQEIFTARAVKMISGSNAVDWEALKRIALYLKDEPDDLQTMNAWKRLARLRPAGEQHLRALELLRVPGQKGECNCENVDDEDDVPLERYGLGSDDSGETNDSSAGDDLDEEYCSSEGDKASGKDGWETDDSGTSSDGKSGEASDDGTDDASNDKPDSGSDPSDTKTYSTTSDQRGYILTERSSRPECLLYRHSNVDATDPRDRIYALLGMTACRIAAGTDQRENPQQLAKTDRFSGSHDARDNIRLLVDYSLTTSRVFQDLTKYIVNRDADIDVLRDYLPHRRIQRDIELPSWCPDWRQPLSHWAYKDDTTYDLGLTKLAWQAADDAGVLRVKGFVWATVTEACATADLPEPPPIVASSLKNRKKSKKILKKGANRQQPNKGRSTTAPNLKGQWFQSLRDIQESVVETKRKVEASAGKQKLSVSSSASAGSSVGESDEDETEPRVPDFAAVMTSHVAGVWQQNLWHLHEQDSDGQCCLTDAPVQPRDALVQTTSVAWQVFLRPRPEGSGYTFVGGCQLPKLAGSPKYKRLMRQLFNWERSSYPKGGTEFVVH